MKRKNYPKSKGTRLNKPIVKRKKSTIVLPRGGVRL